MALLTNINGKFSVSDAGAVTFNNAFTFPTTDGTANYVLQTNGSGQLAWALNGNGDISGSGTANTVTKFTGAKTIGDGPITFATNDSTFAGNVRVNSWIKGASDTNTLFSNTSLGTLLQTPSNSGAGAVIHFRNASGTDFQTFSQVDGSATFAGDVTVGGALLKSSGDLQIKAATTRIKGITTNENIAAFIENGAVELYYDNSKKFETTSTGVTVTDTVSATTFSGDLNGTINTVTTATTKGNSTNDTTVATTAFVQNVVGTIPAGLVFQGTWNASTNTPTLTSGSGTTGHFYIVSVAGSTNLDGITDWQVGDWAVFIEQGASDQWEKIDNSSVLSGSGTGGSFAGWSGSGTSVTLGNAPVTFSGNDSTFAGTVAAEDNIHLTDAGTVRAKLLLNASDRDNVELRAESLGSTMKFFTVGTEALELDASQNATFAGNVKLTDEKILGLRNASNDYALQYRDLDFRFIGSADGTTQRKFSFGYYTSDNPAGTWNGKVYINSYSGNVGIGTSSPDSLLHVAADVSTASVGTITIEGRPTGFLGDDIATIDFHNNGTKRADIRMERGNTASDSQIVISTSDAGTLNDALIINEAGNVGIGTTSPGYTLEIAGPSTTSFAYQRTGVSANKWGFHSDNDATYWQNLTSGNLLFTLKNGGNVGIGTTSPLNKLTVQASNTGTQVTTIPVGKFINTGNTFSKLILGSDNANFDGVVSMDNDSTLANTKLRIYIGNGTTATTGHSNDHIVLQGNGNVGIGTDSPGAKLEVRYSTYANTNETATFINGNQPVRVAYDTMVVAQTDVPCLSIIETVGDSTQATEQKLTFAVGDNSAVIGSSSTATNGIYINTARSTSAAGYLTSNGINVARFLNNGYAIFPVRVGIGTTSPSSKLSISGSQTAIDLTRGTAGDSKWGFSSDSTALYIAELSTGSTDYIMTLKETSGNVGIGVTSPSEKLEVNSGSIFVNGEDNGIIVDSVSKRVGLMKYAGHEGVIARASTNDFGIVRCHTADIFDGSSLTYDFYVSGTGNVGIGTTGPSQKLHVVGNIYSVNSGTDGGQIRLANSGGGSNWYWAARTTGLNLGELGAADGRIFIANGGNVGIGTISPDEKLDITGGYLKFNGGDYGLKGSASLTYNPASDHYFQASGSTKVTFKASGNVGIGTTLPSGPFHVKVGTSTPLIVASSSYCNNVGIRTTTPTASLQVKGNVSYSYNNYTNVANTWINVINFSGYPAGLYQISIIKKTNASTYITAIVQWSATAGTVISTIASNQLGITFSGTQLQAISGIATGTLMSANLQCLVTNEDFCS